MKAISISKSITNRSEINDYLKDVAKIPLLTKEEEIDLATKARNGDKKAKDLFVMSNLKLVLSLVQKYGYKKDIEEETNDESEKDDDIDFVTNLEYKNHFTHFKSSIVKASILYLDFWSLLLNPNQDSQEDLSKLNDYGAKINILVEEINSRFDKMQK